MKNVYFLCIITCFVSSVHAQIKDNTIKTKNTNSAKIIYNTTKTDTALANFLSGELCLCIKPLADSIPQMLVNFTEEIETVGADKAKANYKISLEKLSPEEQKEVEAIRLYLVDRDKYQNPINACIKIVEKKYSNFKFKDTPGKSDAMPQIILYALKSNCTKVKALSVLMTL